MMTRSGFKYILETDPKIGETYVMNKKFLTGAFYAAFYFRVPWQRQRSTPRPCHLKNGAQLTPETLYVRWHRQ